MEIKIPMYISNKNNSNEYLIVQTSISPLLQTLNKHENQVSSRTGYKSTRNIKLQCKHEHRSNIAMDKLTN